MDGRSRARQVVDFVHLDIELKGNVMAQHLEMRISHKVRDIVFGAGEEIVHTQHVVAIGEQTFAQM